MADQGDENCKITLLVLCLKSFNFKSREKFSRDFLIMGTKKLRTYFRSYASSWFLVYIFSRTSFKCFLFCFTNIIKTSRAGKRKNTQSHLMFLKSARKTSV